MPEYGDVSTAPDGEELKRAEEPKKPGHSTEEAPGNLPSSGFGAGNLRFPGSTYRALELKTDNCKPPHSPIACEHHNVPRIVPLPRDGELFPILRPCVLCDQCGLGLKVRQLHWRTSRQRLHQNVLRVFDCAQPRQTLPIRGPPECL